MEKLDLKIKNFKNEFMTYEQSLMYLDELERFGIEFCLERTIKLLELSGNPHTKLKTIHITGTNGKGSTAAFISSILTEAGYKVGTYTSPHLTDFTERIAINGNKIPKKKVAELLSKIKQHNIHIAADPELGHPTLFEVLTVMAFTYFFEEKVDFSVVEAGMGGRWDATNVVKPLISVITNSNYDHMNILGSKVSNIAQEHAGIIKKDGLVITASHGEALDALQQPCQQFNARLYRVGIDITHEFLESDWETQSFNVKGIFSKFKNLTIQLLGKHQLMNACCAIGAIELLKFHHILIGNENIRRGLSTTSLPGRFEILGHSPRVILDGAHNQPAAKQLKKCLLEYCKKKNILY